jgi:hypothetical protein
MEGSLLRCFDYFIILTGYNYLNLQSKIFNLKGGYHWPHSFLKFLLIAVHGEDTPLLIWLEFPDYNIHRRLRPFESCAPAG